MKSTAVGVSRENRKKAVLKGVPAVIALLLSLVICSPGLTFPKAGQGGEQKNATQPAQATPQAQPQSSPEEMEKLKKLGREEAKKVVAAKVNGAPITMDVVVNTMNRIAAKKGSAAASPEGLEEIKKEALDRLIFQELAYQKAKSLDLKVDKDNIDSAIANLKANLGSEEEYKGFLEQQQVTEEELRAQVERSLSIELIFAKEVLDKITIPEDEVKKEYEKQKDKYIKPEKVSVVDVVFFLKTDDEESPKKAENILRKIKESNNDPWKLVLDGTFIVRNMELRKDKHKELYEAAKKLKVNELSEVIKVSDGFHIIKLVEYSPEGHFTYDEAKASIEGKFRVQAQQERLKEWQEELRKDAKIEIIETKESEKKSADGDQEKKDKDTKQEEKK